jgi:hypothetical protein
MIITGQAGTRVTGLKDGAACPTRIQNGAASETRLLKKWDLLWNLLCALPADKK